MMPQKEIKILLHKAIKNFLDIIAVIQFGSSVSGDYVKNLSDVDLAIIIKSRNRTAKEKSEEKIRKFLFKHIPKHQLLKHHLCYLFFLHEFILAFF